MTGQKAESGLLLAILLRVWGEECALKGRQRTCRPSVFSVISTPSLAKLMNTKGKAQLFDVKHKKAGFPLSENPQTVKFLSSPSAVNKLSHIKALKNRVRKVANSCDTINPRLAHPQRYR